MLNPFIFTCLLVAPMTYLAVCCLESYARLTALSANARTHRAKAKPIEENERRVLVRSLAISCYLAALAGAELLVHLA